MLLCFLNNSNIVLSISNTVKKKNSQYFRKGHYSWTPHITSPARKSDVITDEPDITTPLITSLKNIPLGVTLYPESTVLPSFIPPESDR